MTFTGSLLDKIVRTADATSFRFSRPSDYLFQPGQHYGITLATPAGPLTHRFSHADSPTEPFIELTTRLTGSPFKDALDALPLGGTATFEGPAGQFLFRPDAPRIVFLVGGIGITPVRSMLRYLADTAGTGTIDGQEIVLLYGCMTEQEIIYRDELDRFAQTLPGLRVVYVITEPTDEWRGRSGFITAAMIAEELQHAPHWFYYIVGPPPMIAAMQEVTERLGVPEAQVAKESFAGYDSQD